MKPCRRLALVLVSLAVPGAAFAQAPPAHSVAKPERVREMLVLAGVPRQAEMIAEQLIKLMRQSTPAVPEEFWAEVRTSMSSGEYLDLLVPIYQKHLSATDVEAAIAYWKSEPGRRFSDAQPKIMAESEEAGRQWGTKLVEQVLAKLGRQPRREK